MPALVVLMRNLPFPNQKQKRSGLRVGNRGVGWAESLSGGWGGEGRETVTEM